MKVCKIYIIRNKVNDKVYVGQTWQTIRARFNRHMRINDKNVCPKLNNAIKKYGVENFYINELAVAYTQEQANFLEVAFIEIYNSTNKGYNIAFGGVSRKLSKEGRVKISNANKGKKITEETRKRMRNKQLGKKLSKETKQKISNARKGTKSQMKGKKMSDEAKQKMSLAAKKRWNNKNQKEVLVKAAKKRWLSSEERKKQSIRTKKYYENNELSEDTRNKLSNAAHKRWDKKVDNVK